MCGVFAFMNYNVPRERRYILEVLFNGLKRLEHRGYDSAGIAIDGDLSSALPLVFRQEGKIELLVRHAYSEMDAMGLGLEKSFMVHAGIAHTRWATHGVPSLRNSHPQSSDLRNEFLVVHNGIITNYEVLKETLIRHGFTFESDTDTEVIPKLAKFIFDQAHKGNQAITFSQVIIEVMRQIEGAYALIFKSSHYPNELIACRRGSTLILGVKSLTDDEKNHTTSFGDVKSLRTDGKPKEFFFSSDLCAIVEHTKNYLDIEDNEVVHLKDGNISVLKFDYNKEKPISVQRALSVLEMDVEQIKKGNYDHFMQKEIHEQPHSLTTTMRGRLREKTVVLGGFKNHMKTIRHSNKIIFVGCGTSYNAALSAEFIMQELSGITVILERASKLVDKKGSIINSNDTVVFVSQSGETADVLFALEYALSKGALCVGITNTVGSTLSRKTHCGIHMNAGCEIGVASTKAYTSQIVVIIILALAIGAGNISTQSRRESIINGLFDLPDKVREVLNLDDEMKDLAKSLMQKQSLLVSGRGYNHATALEGALKVKEITRIHSEGIYAGELKHGPLALVDETLPILVIATRDDYFSEQQSLIEQLHARKGDLIVMCSKGDAASVCCGGSCRLIEVPLVEDCLQPVINIIPLQLLAYHITLLRGYDVDQPRNLAKSVTTR